MLLAPPVKSLSLLPIFLLSKEGGRLGGERQGSP